VKAFRFSGKTDLVSFGDLCSIGVAFVVVFDLSGWLRLLHGGGPVAIAQSLPYRSPVVKLVRFFCRSRNKWEAKCKAAKKENKSLKTRLAAMKASRDCWKAKARGLAESLRAEVGAVEKEAAQKAKSRVAPGGGRRRARLGVAAAG
jgi:hypothetical protein